MSWISLHNHSQYSILHSTISIKDLVSRAKSLNMKALALTDFCNMFGAIDFYKTCKLEDIKPILGLEIMLAPSSRTMKRKEGTHPSGYPITLLAKDLLGYQNLCKLTSIAYLEGFYYTPRIDKELLKNCKEGLICFSGSSRSYISSLVQKDEQKLLEEIAWYQQVFGEDFYLEVQSHEMKEQDLIQHGMNKESWLYQHYLSLVEKQKAVLDTFKSLSKKLDIPCVATNEVQYLKPEDYKAHEILMNVQSGEPCEIWQTDSLGNRKNRIPNPKRQVLFSHEYYFKSEEQMVEAFEGFPEAISNAALVADKCNLEFDFSKKYYPVFIPPDLENKEYDDQTRIKKSEEYLIKLCEEGIANRYDEAKLAKVKEQYPDQDPLQVVRNRLQHELEIITSKGLCDYLLIVHDFISWAKKQRIPVGPGRGSGVGSIILYLIGVTDIEPLRFNLFFERFINPERLSYPDIDVDICMDRRSEVIEYTLQKYGRDKVAQIITFGTMKAKMAIKDVGRVLSVPLAKVNAIAKLVPDDLNMTLDKALDIDADFRNMYETDEDAHQVIDFARKVEGSIRNTGIHAAGIIICGDSLMQHIPVCTAKDADIMVTQFSMKPVEMVGMLKIDFLGLKTLTSIQKAVDAIEESKGIDIDWVNLPLDDHNTFDLLNQGKTLGIFQLESSGMQDLARQVHIDKFEEIIAVGALYRPGPMEMIPSYIARKHGREEIENDHPWMQDILKETYGIIVYQEQVMQIAQKLAAYSLGEGDVLRRAMGKKDHEQMSQEREKFKQGAGLNQIDEKLSMQIFNKVEKFASYGFNKSHSAAYGYLTYITAYLKANYPSQWMSALMTCDMDDLTKVAKYIRESQAMNIAILPPDVNESSLSFVATDRGIRFSLAAIKGIGQGVVEEIINNRSRLGPYQSLQDFIKRLDAKKVGKKVIENLIDAGAFDFCHEVRAKMQYLLLNQYDSIVKKQKEEAKGILDFFADDKEHNQLQVVDEDIPEVSKLQILKKEKELLGFYITGHPLQEFSEKLHRLKWHSLDELNKLADQSVIKTAFVIDAIQVRLSNKTQKKFAFLTITSGVDRYELPIWPDLFSEIGDLLEENHLLFATLVVEKDQYDVHLQAKYLCDLALMDETHAEAAEEALKKAKKYLTKSKDKSQYKDNLKKALQRAELKLDIEGLRLSHILQLKNIFHKFPGPFELTVHFMSKQTAVSSIHIDSGYGINAENTELHQELKSLPFYQELSLTE